ncbi:18089_t:CDS:2, partial [Gigaspora rosea]
LINNYATAISNKIVFDLIQNHEFFNQCRYISAILKPIKDMINQLESRHATIADCYVALIKIAAAINRLPDANLFKSKAVNLRFRSTGLKRGQFNQISETAAAMWQELGYDEASCVDLLMELHAYKRKEKPYTQTFKKERESPLNWWLINSSQLEFEQSEEFSNSFNPISGSCNTNMQLDDMDGTNLLIEEIIDLSNPAFIGNNNSFIENQNIVVNHNTQRVGSGNLNYNPANLVA